MPPAHVDARSEGLHFNGSQPAATKAECAQSFVITEAGS
jgi:hypothetical protein